MMLEELKKLGVGMIINHNNRMIFVEFDKLTQLGKTNLLKIESDDVFELLFKQIPGNIIQINFMKMSQYVYTSKWFVLRLQDLDKIEIITNDSNFYKGIIESRSNITVVNSKQKILKFNK